MSPPLKIGLGLSMVQPSTSPIGGGGDPDASAYVAAVNATAATVSPTQEAAIDSFFIRGKSVGWYAKMKRIFFPIWGSAAPNAIDMVDRATGNFGAGISHFSGYAKGNAGSGCYFHFDLSPVALGMSRSDQSLFLLVKQEHSGNSCVYLGSVQSTSTRITFMQSSATTMMSNLNNTSGGQITYPIAGSQAKGVFVISREAGDRRIHNRTNAGGFATYVNASAIDSGTLPSIPSTAFAGATTGAPAITLPGDMEMGLYGQGLGLTVAQAEDFSEAIKDLWETCTGLVLP